MPTLPLMTFLFHLHNNYTFYTVFEETNELNNWLSVNFHHYLLMSHLQRPIKMSVYELRACWRQKHVADSVVGKNGGLVFTLCSAKGAPLEGLLSESVWITPLCASTHDRELRRERKWRTQKTALQSSYASLFLYFSSFSFYQVWWLKCKMDFFYSFSHRTKVCTRINIRVRISASLVM